MHYPHDILMSAQKPARYTGGEAGAVVKNKEDVAARFCLCFPDVYEVGMSWTGLNILYSMINDRADMACERAFAPWIDMEALLRENALPLKTLESGDSLDNMDMLGFSLNYELGYTNMLAMLELGGVPLLASERGDDSPIVCAGGPSTCNPEPLSDFVDFFYIGEAEAGFCDVLDIFAKGLARGVAKERFLLDIAGLPGVYVPRFYDALYNEDGTLQSLVPNRPDVPAVIKKAAPSNLDEVFLPTSFIVPNLGSVHDRAALEVFRGCGRGCRFCQAGFIYRPRREFAPGRLLAHAKHMLDCTGYDELSLLSLSTSDYSAFRELAEGALELADNLTLSLPSLRMDAFTIGIMERASGGRKSGLTFAPEAGSQRMRDVINKNLTEEEILTGCRLAFLGGWSRIKLYFMLGLPYETDSDVEAIAILAAKIVDEFYRIPKDQRGRGLTVNVSASCFVPKPHTPFQFVPQTTPDALEAKQRLLKRAIMNTNRAKQIKYSYHNADAALIEGALARGDRRVGRAILHAYRQGARFDGWSEHFNFQLWQESFAHSDLDVPFYTHRHRAADEPLPWDHIQTGPSKPFLIKELENAQQGITTVNCMDGCARCGAAECLLEEGS